jgi:hypothetical protein
VLVQQINPHFLFNALNTVYALVLEGDDARVPLPARVIGVHARIDRPQRAAQVPLLRGSS